MNQIKSVYVTGGSGYVGAVLVPKLLRSGYKVTVLDLFLYGKDVLDSVKDDPNLTLIQGDLRNAELLKQSIPGHDALIHLACISNDPSYELDPVLSKSINFDAFEPLVRISRSSGVRRFVYASSSSVYGIKDEPEVTEDLPLEPLTDYSRYKALCEEILNAQADADFCATTIRPATVCGYSPRLRLDLAVNILTNHALNKGKITVFGGSQKRPNLHIEDMADVYPFILRQPETAVQKKIYNVGYENLTVLDIARKVKETLNLPVDIEVVSSNDLRSYHVSARKIKEELGFVPGHTIEQAVEGLKAAFDAGKVPNSMDDPRYFNIRLMQAEKLT